MIPVKLRGTCPLKVQQLKIGGGGHVPARLPGAPMIKPPPPISNANFAYASLYGTCTLLSTSHCTGQWLCAPVALTNTRWLYNRCSSPHQSLSTRTLYSTRAHRRASLVTLTLPSCCHSYRAFSSFVLCLYLTVLLL